jgi:hypothetical protein
VTGDIEIFPELKIKTLPTLLAALRQPGPRRDVFEQQSGRFVVSFDLFPVRAAVLREAIASAAVVETYPGKNAPYWRVPEMVEKPRRRQYRTRQAPRRRGRPRKAA